MSEAADIQFLADRMGIPFEEAGQRTAEWEEKFGYALEDLMKAAGVEALRTQWAVLNKDLRIVGFESDLYAAEEQAGREGYRVRVPDGMVRDGQYVKAELIAGLAYCLVVREVKGTKEREHCADRLEGSVVQLLMEVNDG